MEKLSSEQIRNLWKSFWESQGHDHKEAKPNSLIPDSQDKTVLFTTAGMQQLVPFLMGKVHPQGKRVYNIQKCVRTGDIEEVGDHSHLTFFEMMGNWSLGDYFKKDAISWSYEFLTRHLGIDPKKLAVTVFEGDKDAGFDQASYDFWLNIGIPEHKISKMGKKDNWWGPAGETGPCGPDTEIFYRIGKEDFPPLESNKKNDDDNWMEIWNNVFMEFYKDEKSEFSQLSQQNVDTGMGFERINMVLQGVSTVYETDIFKGIIEIISTHLGIKYPGFGKLDKFFDDSEKTIARRIRIMSDHIRTSSFMIGDGVIPSNEGRGYVLRRLIRRMTYNLLLLNDKIDFEKFINEIIGVIEKKYGAFRQEISINKKSIVSTLINEINQFKKTINNGIKEFDKIINDIKNSTTPNRNYLTGKEAFLLYDTYGLPIDVINEIAFEKGFAERGTFPVPLKEFEQEMEIAREKSRQGTKDMFKKGIDWAKYLEGVEATIFTGYDNLENNESKLLKKIEIEGSTVLVFDKSPFYAESGGQTGDKGIIIMDDGSKYEIIDVQKYAGVFLHFVK